MCKYLHLKLHTINIRFSVKVVFILVIFCCCLQDLESKSVVDELKLEVISMSSGKDKGADCKSLAWSADGQTLFAGYTDNVIRVWQVQKNV